MKNERTRLRLEIVADPDTDAEELDELTRRLRQELLEYDLGSIDMTHAAAAVSPLGAKGDPVTLGALLVTLAASGGVLTTAVKAVQSWLTRQERRSVTVEIGGDKLVISSISTQQQQQLVDDFIRHHQKN